MMTVKELIKNLKNFALVTPNGLDAEVMLQYDGDVCIEFGRADHAGGTPGQNFLIFKPAIKGKRIGIRDVGIRPT